MNVRALATESTPVGVFRLPGLLTSSYKAAELPTAVPPSGAKVLLNMEEEATWQLLSGEVPDVGISFSQEGSCTVHLYSSPLMDLEPS